MTCSQMVRMHVYIKTLYKFPGFLFVFQGLAQRCAVSVPESVSYSSSQHRTALNLFTAITFGENITTTATDMINSSECTS